MLSLRSMITVVVTAALSLSLAIGASPQARAKVQEAAAKARLAAEATLSWAQASLADLEAQTSGSFQARTDASAEADGEWDLNGPIATHEQTRIGAEAEIDADAQTGVESSLDLGQFFDWILEMGLGFGARSGANAQAGAGS